MAGGYISSFERKVSSVTPTTGSGANLPPVVELH